MRTAYFLLAAFHIVAIVVTGVLWTMIDVGIAPKLRPHFRDIRAVHFGSLYLVPWFFGLAYAFERLKVPDWHQGTLSRWVGSARFLRGGRLRFSATAGIGPVLLLDPRLGPGAFDDRTCVSGVGARLDRGGVGRVLSEPLIRRTRLADSCVRSRSEPDEFSPGIQFPGHLKSLTLVPRISGAQPPAPSTPGPPARLVAARGHHRRCRRHRLLHRLPGCLPLCARYAGRLSSPRARRRAASLCHGPGGIASAAAAA